MLRMEQNNFSQPESPYHPKHHIKVYVWIALVVAAVLLAINGYLYFLKLSALEQGAKTAQENEQRIQELRAQRSPSTSSGQVPSDWKTYRNEEYGFEFRYPSSGTLTVDDKLNQCGQAFSPKGCIGVSVRFTNGSIFEYRRFPQYDIVGKETNISIDGTDRRMIQRDQEYFIGLNDMDNINFMNNDGQSDYQLFLDILSTFKFTDSTGSPQADSADTSNWKTYTNTQYGFEFKYPADMTVNVSTYSGLTLTLTSAALAQRKLDYPEQFNGEVYGFDSQLIVSETTLSDTSQLIFPSCAQHRATTMVGSYKAISFDGCDLGGPAVIQWVYKGFLYTVIPASSSIVVNQVLPTFKFTK